MKDINFFEGIKKSTPQKRASRAVRLGIVALSVVILIIGVLYGGVYAYQMYIQRDLDSVQSQIDGLHSQNPGLDQLSAKKSRLSSLQTYAQLAAGFEAGVSAYPRMDAAFVNSIERLMPADVTLISFQYSDGTLTLSCMAEDARSPANFALALESLESLERVYYSGNFLTKVIVPSPSPEPDQEPAETPAQTPGEEPLGEELYRYQFTIECLLRGGQDQ